MNNNQTEALQQQVIAAYANGTPLSIHGGKSKNFLGQHYANTQALDVSKHVGIVNYEPVELVVTACAGTTLKTLEATLADNGQMLPFEPPAFGDNATLGGCVASGLSGPARPFNGSVRDYVLGVKIINGRGEILRFGGQVMKNVAGYDCSRLMAGAMGTLGVLLEISLKVLPKPASETTLIKKLSVTNALEEMNRWAARPYPLSAACYDGEKLYLRLSGSKTAVESASKIIGGDKLENDVEFWYQLKEHKHLFFTTDKKLWRLSVPSTTPTLNIPGKCFIDWGGAQRWLISNEPADKIRDTVKKYDGHATLFHGKRDIPVFQLPEKNVLLLHKRLKKSFDPKGILNPGRLYSEL